MTDDEKFLGPDLALAAKPKFPYLRVITIVVAALLLVAATAGGTLWLQRQGIVMPARTPAAAPADTSALAGLERRVDALEKRVTELSSHVDDIAGTPASGTEQGSGARASDLSRVQSDVTALASTIGSLQAEMKSAGSVASSMRGEAVAFLQLRDAADAGHGFSRELNAMRVAAGGDTAIQQMLDTLNADAEKGVPSLGTLRDELAVAAVHADQAVAKADAQNWWERILAELRGLVSIRPLHGPGTVDAPLQNMQNDLARGDVAAALEDMKALPAPAQTPLETWRQQAEARRALDDGIAALAGQLIAAPAGKTQETP